MIQEDPKIALCSLLGLLQGDLEIHQLQDCYAAVNDTREPKKMINNLSMSMNIKIVVFSIINTEIFD